MKTRMRTRNENNATKNTSAWHKEAPEQRTDRRTQRQTDGWRRLPISDRATLNGIYLDPDVGIESEPKNCMKGSQSNSALLNFDFFCFAFVIEFHSQFVRSSLSQEAKNRVNERSSDRLRHRHRHVWGPRRNDPHSQLTNRRPSRGTDGQTNGQTCGQTGGQTVTARPPHMCDESAAQSHSQSQRSQLCFSFSSFFCQLMIFIEFSRGKKFAKFAAKCSLLAAPQQIIKRADDRERQLSTSSFGVNHNDDKRTQDRGVH